MKELSTTIIVHKDMNNNAFREEKSFEVVIKIFSLFVNFVFKFFNKYMHNMYIIVNYVYENY